MECEVCGKTDDQRPMAFRGESYCSDLHRKILNGEIKSQKQLDQYVTKNENSVVE